MMKTTFLKTVLFAVFAILFGNINAWSETTYFNFSGTTGYLAPPATDWTSLGIVTGGSYLKIATGAVISPAYNASNSLVFKYDIASYGSGVAGSKTILYILDANDNSVISQYTLTTANDKTYIKDQIQNIGSVSKNFKIKIEGLGDGTSATSANKATRLQNYSLTGTEASTCTASNLAFAQSTYNKLASDAAFTQTATSLNGTTPITYSSSNTGVATVNENSGEVSIVGIGSTDIIASQAAGTHNSVAYCASTATYTLSITSTTPTITVTEVTVPDMVAYAGETDAETINISGINLSGNIGLSITGTNANLFTLSTNSVTQTSGTAANTVVTIYYSPTSAGTHTATLNVTSAGATSITRTLNGSATWAPLVKPVATEATGITNTTFTANWNAVASATEYQLDVTSMTSGGGQSAPVLSENFANFTAGQTNASADGTDKSATLDALTQTSGWTGSKVYQAGGAVKVGTSSVLGSLVTPSINLSANGGAFSISFKAMAWSGDATTLKIYVNDILANTVSGLTNDANYTLNPFSVNLTGGNPTTKIKFEGTQAAKGRFFLDDFVVTQGGSVVELPISGSPFTIVGETSKSFTGLSTGTIYKYTVTAKNEHATSLVSNQISVTTSTGTGFNPLKTEFSVSVLNGIIMLNTEAGKNIEIYNSVGQKLLLATSKEGLNTISLSYHGVAIIKIGNQTAKVIL